MTSPTVLSVDDLRAGFSSPPSSTAPMMRWWWFGPSVERAELDRELTAMAAAGIGGVEVAYVYPLAPATTSLLSEEFLADLRFAADRARELGLRFDLTLGSGWSFGGPHIDDHLAAQCLHWERREIPPGPRSVSIEPRWPGEQFVAGFLGHGSIQEQPDDYVRLDVDGGVLQIPDGDGPRQVLVATARLTGQNVKRAAAGAEGPVLDHYSEAATTAHLRAFADPLLGAVPAELIGSVFCDSLEVYDSDWTPELPAEFERRRGYPLLPVLHLLLVDSSAGSDPSTSSGPSTGSRTLRADYHRTLRELYEENFVSVVQRWAADHGVVFRLQGYGTPPAAVSSYRFADLFEGEGWGWDRLPQTRWAASAAHHFGRPVVSAESWTWVHSPSFRATPLDLKAEAHEHFLNGVNLLIGHGWPYSPVDAPSLGWMFYAAGALDDRNPWWPVMNELTTYLSRLCWLLQQGDPVADVAVYVPNDDLFATMGRAQGGTLDLWREASEGIGADIPGIVRRAGYDFDLVDDEALSSIPVDRYPLMIIPSTTVVPEATRAWITELITAGGAVLTTDSTVQLADAESVELDDLADALRSRLQPDLSVTPGEPDIGFVHRRCGDTEIYLVANTGAQPRTITVQPRVTVGRWQRWDALTGASEPIDTDAVELDLAPYQAAVLVGRADDASAQAVTARSNADQIRLDGPWQVSYGDDQPREVTLPHVWEDDPDHRYHSGSATYRASSQIDRPGSTILLDLGPGSPDDAAAGTEGQMVGPSFRARYRGPIGEVAQVRVNGIDCGSLWSPPYRVDISEAVHTGTNELVITVFNTAANALAVDDHIAGLAAASEQRYGRRFRMQELDRAMETVRSGLLDLPRLIVSSA